MATRRKYRRQNDTGAQNRSPEDRSPQNHGSKHHKLKKTAARKPVRRNAAAGKSPVTRRRKTPGK
jgi:hypothetical protein